MILFRSGISFVLSLSIVWASMGFSVNRHYCLGMLKSESFYSSNFSSCCGDDLSNCHKTENTAQRNCCADELLHIDAINIQRKVETGFELNKLAGTVFFNFSSEKPFFFSALSTRLFKNAYYHTSPPYHYLLELSYLQCYLI